MAVTPIRSDLSGTVAKAGHLDGGGDGGDDGGMEARIASLEKTMVEVRERLTRIETKIDGIDKVGATKDGVTADLNKLESTLIKWFVATATALAAMAFAIARYVT